MAAADQSGNTNENSEMDVTNFREKLMSLSPDSHRLTYEELDFLFNIIDQNNDRRIQRNELLALQAKDSNKLF